MQPDMSKTIPSSEWISDDSTPDPNPLPSVRGWRIWVRPVSPVRKTKQGIIIPDTVLDDVQRATCIGRVLAMGSACYTHRDFNGERWCEVGQHIGYGKFDGHKYLIRGVKLIMIEDRDVRMSDFDPADINPAYNLSSY